MSNLSFIRSYPDISAAFDANDDPQVITLSNDATEKAIFDGSASRPGWSSTMAMELDLSSRSMTGFVSILEDYMDYLVALPNLDEARWLQSILDRFNTTEIDMTNETIRKTIKDGLNWKPVDPTPFLALGYSLVGRAMFDLTYDFTQASVDEARREEYDQRVNVAADGSLSAFLNSVAQQPALSDAALATLWADSWSI